VAREDETRYDQFPSTESVLSVQPSRPLRNNWKNNTTEKRTTEHVDMRKRLDAELRRYVMEGYHTFPFHSPSPLRPDIPLTESQRPSNLLISNDDKASASLVRTQRQLPCRDISLRHGNVRIAVPPTVYTLHAATRLGCDGSGTISLPARTHCLSGCYSPAKGRITTTWSDGPRHRSVRRPR
jgi:hypothetical protein